MNWIKELCSLYDRNVGIAGDVTSGRYQEQIVLLPVFHTTVKAQITICISQDGEFLGAERVAQNDDMTVIPVTDESAARTSGIAAHPLCDNLKYIAADYAEYVACEKKKDFSENHRLYLKGLERWATSEYRHPKVAAIYAYITKYQVIKDLAEHKVLTLDDDGRIAKEKINNILQQDSFVRFSVITDDLDDEMPSECWRDSSLFDSYIEFCRGTAPESARGLSYLTGEVVPLSELHPKKIRNEGDGTKLFSSNDNDGYTYRGRFADKKEAFAIGYEDSQKLHNALKWMIRRQGKNYKELCVVTWETNLCDIPEWDDSTDGICQRFFPEDSGQKSSARFLSAIDGYKTMLCSLSDSKIVIMALSAATPGRLSVLEASELSSSVYLSNLQSWHEECEWLQPSKGGGYLGMVSIDDTVRLLYGREDDKGHIVLKGSAENMRAEICNRLRKCIIYGHPLPQDIVRLAYRRASAPETFSERYNWEKVLALACSLIKKHEKDIGSKEEWNSMSLNKESRDRSYLFGRLLAVADRMEYRTYDGEQRQTNAKRYMNAFSQRPFRTWTVIEERLEPYKMKLKTGERLYLEHLIEEIFDMFDGDDFSSDKPLDGKYLLGFHNQSYALRNKTQEENSND